MCQKINKLLCISLFFTVVHAKPKWIYPSKSLCSQYKGFYDSSEGICEANLNNGIKICEAMGARLPILKEYKDIAQACGDIIVDKKDISCNDKSKYRACYEKVGFYRIGSYFTSTQELRSDMYYTFSFLGAKTYYTRKTYGRFIACVKE